MKFFDKKENNMGQSEPPVPPPAQPATKPAEVKYQPPAPAPAPAHPAPTPSPAQRRGSNTVIGTNLTIRGDITADENITIEGTVEGTIESTNDVIVAPEGRVRADIRANTITVSGKVKGNMFATNKVDLTSTGQLEGNIQAPKLAIAESAMFKGSIDMSPPGQSQSRKPESRVQQESELVKK